MADIHSNRRRMLATLGVMTTSALAGCSGNSDDGEAPSESDSESSPDTSESADYFVSPDGADENDGSQDSPLGTITEGLNRAQPGETVQLAPGEYNEVVWTVRDGKPEAPISLIGPPDAVIRPPADAYGAVRIDNHHFQLQGMTITGLSDPARKLEDKEAYATVCVQASSVGRKEEGVEYINGVVIEPAKIGHAAGPLVQTQRIRNASIGNFEVIGPAGMAFDRRIDNFEHGHVREIVYIGSPETHRGKQYYKYETLDRSRNIRVHHIDNSAGYRHNELVDVKLGSSNVVIEYCTTRNGCHNSEGSVDPAIAIQGNDCTIRWNDIQGCPVPISFGAWGPSDDIDQTNWSRNNAVYDNVIRNFGAGPFRLLDDPERNLGPASFDAQRTICGNEIERGDPQLDPWIPPTNGYDGTVADQRGQDEIEITVEEGPEGFRHSPPVAFVDPDTTVTWKWDGTNSTHYIVQNNRWMHDDTIPAPFEGPQSKEHGSVGLRRWAGSAHYSDNARTTIITVSPEDRYDFARNECGDVPEGDDVGHLGGDSRWD